MSVYVELTDLGDEGKSHPLPSLALMMVSVNCVICPGSDYSHSLLLACM